MRVYSSWRATIAQCLLQKADLSCFRIRLDHCRLLPSWSAPTELRFGSATGTLCEVPGGALEPQKGVKPPRRPGSRTRGRRRVEVFTAPARTSGTPRTPERQFAGVCSGSSAESATSKKPVRATATESTPRHARGGDCSVSPLVVRCVHCRVWGAAVEKNYRVIPSSRARLPRDGQHLTERHRARHQGNSEIV